MLNNGSGTFAIPVYAIYRPGGAPEYKKNKLEISLQKKEEMF
jgi:hypothetical protein